MLLESRADYEFAQRLNTNLHNMVKEMEKFNSNTKEFSFQKLYDLIRAAVELPVPDGVSDEFNRVLSDCQNLYESLQMARDELNLS